VAVAPPAAARLMPEEFEEQRRFFESVIYNPMPMPVFYLDRPLRRDVWCYFNDPCLRRAFMFALDEHSKVPEMSPGGKSVLTVWTGHPMTLEMMPKPDSEIIKQAQEDLELMIPGVSQWIDDVALVRHPYGVARYPVGAYRRVLDFRRQAGELKGVSFVSDLFGGCYMEAAMASAAAAVATTVFTMASTAVPVASRLEPALKPNQPTQSSDAPIMVMVRLCGAMALFG